MCLITTKTRARGGVSSNLPPANHVVGEREEFTCKFECSEFKIRQIFQRHADSRWVSVEFSSLFFLFQYSTVLSEEVSWLDMWFLFQLKPGSSLPTSMAGRTVRVAIQCGALNSDTPFRTTCVMFKIKGVISCKRLAFQCSSLLVWIAALLLFTSTALLSPDNNRAGRERFRPHG